MKTQRAVCTLCSRADAVLECEEDNARLCAACDELVHGANKLSNRHTRWPLCSFCSSYKATRVSVIPAELAPDEKNFACEACAARLPASARPAHTLLAPLPPLPIRESSPPQGGARRAAGPHNGSRSHHKASVTSQDGSVARASGTGGTVPTPPSSGYAMRHKRTSAAMASPPEQQPNQPTGHGTRSHGHARHHASGHAHEKSAGLAVQLMELSTDNAGTTKPPTPVLASQLSSPPCGLGADAGEMDVGPGTWQDERQFMQGLGDPRTSDAGALERQLSLAPQQSYALPADDTLLPDGGRSSAGRQSSLPEMSLMNSFSRMQQMGGPGSDDTGMPPAPEMLGGDAREAVRVGGARDSSGSGGPVFPGVGGSSDEPDLLDNLFCSWTHEMSATPGLGGMGPNSTLEELLRMDLDDPAPTPLVGSLMRGEAQAGPVAGRAAGRRASRGPEQRMWGGQTAPTGEAEGAANTSGPSKQAGASQAQGRLHSPRAGDWPDLSAAPPPQHTGSGRGTSHAQNRPSGTLEGGARQDDRTPSVFSLQAWPFDQVVRTAGLDNTQAPGGGSALGWASQGQRAPSPNAVGEPWGRDAGTQPAVKPDPEEPARWHGLAQGGLRGAPSSARSLTPRYSGMSAGQMPGADGGVNQGRGSFPTGSGGAKQHQQQAPAAELAVPPPSERMHTRSDTAAAAAVAAQQQQMTLSLAHAMQQQSQAYFASLAAGQAAASASAQRDNQTCSRSPPPSGDAGHEDALLHQPPSAPVPPTDKGPPAPPASVHTSADCTGSHGAGQVWLPGGMDAAARATPSGMPHSATAAEQQQHAAAAATAAVVAAHAMQLQAALPALAGLPMGMHPGMLPQWRGAGGGMSDPAAALLAMGLLPPDALAAVLRAGGNPLGLMEGGPGLGSAMAAGLGAMLAGMQQGAGGDQAGGAPQVPHHLLPSLLHPHVLATLMSQQQALQQHLAQQQSRSCLPTATAAGVPGSGVPGAGAWPSGSGSGGGMHGAGGGNDPEAAAFAAAAAGMPGELWSSQSVHQHMGAAQHAAAHGWPGMMDAGSSGAMGRPTSSKGWPPGMDAAAMAAVVAAMAGGSHASGSEQHHAAHPGAQPRGGAVHSNLQASPRPALGSMLPPQQLPYGVQYHPHGSGSGGNLPRIPRLPTGSTSVSGDRNTVPTPTSSSARRAGVSGPSAPAQPGQPGAGAMGGLMMPPLPMQLGLPPGLALNPFFLHPDRFKQMVAPWMMQPGGELPPGLLQSALPLNAYGLPHGYGGAAGPQAAAPTMCSVRTSGSVGEAPPVHGAGGMQGGGGRGGGGPQPAASHFSPPSGPPQHHAMRGGATGMTGQLNTRGSGMAGLPGMPGMPGCVPGGLLPIRPGAAMSMEAAWARELRTSERGQALTRYRQKRKLRHFEKTIRYESRQVRAHKRPRMKGRFVKMPSGAAADGSTAGPGGLNAPLPPGQTPSTLAVMRVVGEELTEGADGQDEDLLMDDRTGDASLGHLSSTDADADVEQSDEGGANQRARGLLTGSPGRRGGGPGNGPGGIGGGGVNVPIAPPGSSLLMVPHQSSVNEHASAHLGGGPPVGCAPSAGAPAPAELLGEQPPPPVSLSTSITSRASMGSVRQGGVHKPHACGPGAGPGVRVRAASALLRGAPSAGAGEAMDIDHQDHGHAAGQEGSVLGPSGVAAKPSVVMRAASAIRSGSSGARGRAGVVVTDPPRTHDVSRGASGEMPGAGGGSVGGAGGATLRSDPPAALAGGLASALALPALHADMAWPGSPRMGLLGMGGVGPAIAATGESSSSSSSSSKNAQRLASGGVALSARLDAVGGDGAGGCTASSPRIPGRGTKRASDSGEGGTGGRQGSSGGRGSGPPSHRVSPTGRDKQPSGARASSASLPAARGAPAAGGTGGGAGVSGGGLQHCASAGTAVGSHHLTGSCAEGGEDGRGGDPREPGGGSGLPRGAAESRSEACHPAVAPPGCAPGVWRGAPRPQLGWTSGCGLGVGARLAGVPGSEDPDTGEAVFCDSAVLPEVSGASNTLPPSVEASTQGCARTGGGGPGAGRELSTAPSTGRTTAGALPGLRTLAATPGTAGPPAAPGAGSGVHEGPPGSTGRKTGERVPQ